MTAPTARGQRPAAGPTAARRGEGLARPEPRGPSGPARIEPASSTAAVAEGLAAADARGTATAALLHVQADLRKAKTHTELGYLIANEARSVLAAQQVVVFAQGIGQKLVVHTVSSLARIDRSAPLVLWLESLPAALAAQGHLDRVNEFEASAYPGAFQSVAASYPLRHLLWLPWRSRAGDVESGLLLARSTPWSEPDIKIATYLAGAAAHAWYALAGTGSAWSLSRAVSRRSLAIAAGIVAALLLVPVPMTALAPVEITPRDTTIVSPGIEGIVDSVEVEPNAEVKAGQVLVLLNDTNLRNRAAIAERDANIADAKFRKAVQLAFLDARGRHDMAVARSELDLKLAERDYARELLQRTVIRAERDGVAFFADKRDLIGKPVTVGEKLMEVAQPSSNEFRIELPVADAIVLKDQARVKVFLDSDPLNPIEARLVRASYKAAPREAQQFAFRLIAQTVDAELAGRLRLGLRGTAQIYSDQVPLAFYLFRRPIAAARQWSGL